MPLLLFLALLFVSPVHSGFIRASDAQNSAPNAQPVFHSTAQTPDDGVVDKAGSSCVDSNESLTCDLLVGADKSICSKQLASGGRLQDLCPTHCNCCNVGGQCTCNDDTTVESIAQSYGIYYVHSCADALQYVQCNDTRFAKRLRQYCPCFCQEHSDEIQCFDIHMRNYNYNGWEGAVLTVTSCDGETTFVSATLASGGEATEMHCFAPPEEGVVLTVTSGDSPNDVSWSIADAGSTDYFISGGAPFWHSFCEESPTQNCYNVHMADSFGDGWNGATLSFISCDGAVLESVTLSGGHGENRSVCLDSSITAFAIDVTGGAYPLEVSWYIEEPNNAGTLFSGGAPFQFSTCSEYQDDGCMALNFFDSGQDGWNGATFTVSSCVTGEQYLSTTLESGAYNSFQHCFPDSVQDGVSVVVTSGEKPQEVSFTVVNGRGETVLSGIAPFSWNDCTDTSGKKLLF